MTTETKTPAKFLTWDPSELRNRFVGLNTAQDVAELLQVKYSKLVWHLYKVPAGSKYVTFEIAKASGNPRKISTRKRTENPPM